MDHPQSSVMLGLVPPALDKAGLKGLKAAVVTVGRCLDAWRGFVGAVVSRPVTVQVWFAQSGELTGAGDGLSITVPGSLIGSPGLRTRC